MNKPLILIITSVLMFSVYAMAANKVVVIPLNSQNSTAFDNKLWGEGRPGVYINGSWQDSPINGIQFGIGSILVSWEGAASGCPVQTWVCTANERGSSSYSMNTSSINCNNSMQTGTLGFGWVADSGSNFVLARKITDGGTLLNEARCYNYFVWCCRNAP